MYYRQKNKKQKNKKQKNQKQAKWFHDAFKGVGGEREVLPQDLAYRFFGKKAFRFCHGRPFAYAARV